MQAVSPWQQADALKRVDYGRSVTGNALPGNHAGKNGSHSDIQQRTDDERSDDADGYVAARVPALFACRRDRVEADVCEEDDGTARKHPGEAVR